MNQSKTKGFFRKRINTKGLLPKQALPPGKYMQHWWNVNVGYVTEDDIRVGVGGVWA